MSDIIDALVGIAPGSPLDGIRRQREQARDNAQLSYLALFQPADPGDVTPAERFAVALFVVGLHRQPDIAAHYREGLATVVGGNSLVPFIETAVADGAAHGPYGDYPAGSLSREDAGGPVFQGAPQALGPKLRAALAHAHMLVFHPRDAAPAALQALLDAGWSTTGIVTLSQLVAFLSFQIRVVAGLRVLAAAA